MEYIMDPAGDVLLTLTNPNKPIAILLDDPPPQQPPTSETTQAAPPSPTSLPSPSSEAPSTSPPVATYRLSSRHLTLSSPVFAAALTGPWTESQTQSSPTLPGIKYHLTAQDMDPTALSTVLAAIHNRHRQIPKRLSLKALARIALVADYYRITEALDGVAANWFEALVKSDTPPPKLGAPSVKGRPSTKTSECVMWIWVTLVLGQEELFEQVTRFAIHNAKGELVSFGMPLPEGVLACINRKRRKAINTAIDTLEETALELLAEKKSLACDLACQMIQVGTIVRALHDLGVEFITLAAPPPPASSSSAPAAASTAALSPEEAGSNQQQQQEEEEEAGEEESEDEDENEDADKLTPGIPLTTSAATVLSTVSKLDVPDWPSRWNNTRSHKCRPESYLSTRVAVATEKMKAEMCGLKLVDFLTW